MKARTTPLLLLLLTGVALLLSACNQRSPAGDQDPSPGTPEAPEITEVRPADAATGVSTTGSITINFSQPMKAPDTEAAVTLSPVVACQFDWNTEGTRLTCKPETELAADETYSLRIGTSARSREGVNLESAWQSEFRTAAEAQASCVLGAAELGRCTLAP